MLAFLYLSESNYWKLADGSKNTVFRENIIGPILFALCYDQYLPFFYSFISFYFHNADTSVLKFSFHV